MTLRAVASGSGSGGITIGTTTITGGTNTRVLFDDSGLVGESANLTYVKATGVLTAGSITFGTAASAATGISQGGNASQIEIGATSPVARFVLGELDVIGNFSLVWGQTTNTFASWAAQTAIGQSGANAVFFNGYAAKNGATSRVEINKATTGIADNTATATLTVTVPNSAQSASLRVTLCGSLGAGGAVGANEATGTITYNFAIARTSGADTVVTASTAFGSATSSVTGGATITITAAASSVSGLSSATQTFTVNVTIAKGSGSSANHTCFAYGTLLNANASGITVA